MIKHVGKHNQRRVAIVYRTVPDEDHMALVVYTDALPQMVHDEAMKVLESEIGQNAKELADALFRTTMADGTNCLTALHKGGWLKKVPCNQVIVTPTAKSTCRLDELNTLLQKIEAGGDAAATLADMDKNRGIRGANPNVTEGRELGQPAVDPTRTTAGDVTGDVLSDEALSNQRIDQARKLESEAKGLLAEAKRLKQEATKLSQPKAKNVRATKKATA
jgi:hypothetical protein